METLKYIILWMLTPIQKVMQRLGKSECLITRSQVDSILAVARPGDILLSHETQRLTSYFIKGFWDHAAIVSSRGTVIEAVGTGVREVDLEEWLFKKDYVKVIRTYFSNTVCLSAGTASLEFIGYKYNFTFSWINPFHVSRNRRGVYCSQLVYECYLQEMKTFKDLMPMKSEILPIDFEIFNTVIDTTQDLPKESKQ